MQLRIEFGLVALDGDFAAVEQGFELADLAVMLVVEQHVFGGDFRFAEEGLDSEFFEGVLIVFGSSVLIFQHLDFKFGERTGCCDRFSIFLGNQLADVAHGGGKIARVTCGDDGFDNTALVKESGLEGGIEGQVGGIVLGEEVAVEIDAGIASAEVVFAFHGEEFVAELRSQ